MTIKPGLCFCGCGSETRIAAKTRKDRGWVKGEPMKYLAGHNRRGVRREKVEPRVAPRPEKNYYPEAAARQFIHYLLCWKAGVGIGEIFRRDPAEFRAILQKFINQDRTDQAGKHEIAAARRELAALE